MQVDLPRAYQFLDTPARYKVAIGGRGKAATRSIATWLILKAAAGKERILCTREIQRSIKNSVHRVLADTINRLGLGGFNVTNESITHRVTGSEFIFLGLRSNREEVKGLEGITKAWVSEARATSQDSLDYLLPTIREEGSELIFDINPDEETDPVYQMFVTDGRPDAIVRHLTYRDNPFFPEVLRREMEWTREHDPERYEWVWEGNTRKISEARVFRGKFVEEEFEEHPEKDGGPYYGADWGFSVDPSTLIRCYIKDKVLYVTHEAYAVGADLDALPALFGQVPGAMEYRIIADSARPETIHEMNKRGFHIWPSRKGPGSVEDGITHIRSYEKVVIHTRCPRTTEEFKLYSYKTDKLTGHPLPVLEDKHNHCIDPIRYALEDVTRSVSVAWL
jgi:phage terminase large subunit